MCGSASRGTRSAVANRSASNLSRELSKRGTGRTLYVLDEPSTGLHAADVERLIAVLQTLVDQGNTIVIIEHNPDIIKVADWLIDIGPEGGDLGGYLVGEGTPEQIATIPESYTGQFLAQYMAQHRANQERLAAQQAESKHAAANVNGSSNGKAVKAKAKRVKTAEPT